MPRKRANSDSFLELLAKSSRPVYAVDGRRRIVYCNPALAEWLELEPSRVLGSLVEYHSETSPEDNSEKTASLLIDLCPPPHALNGEACKGTISCTLRNGRLIHRRAEFIPLMATSTDKRQKDIAGPGVLAILETSDLKPEEISVNDATNPTGDELHRTIRHFRRSQASRYSVESILGSSAAIQKVRAQIAAAAASGANVLVRGRRGTGRAHIARAIHYRAAAESPAKLVAVNCSLATEESFRRAIETLQDPSSNDSRIRPTLLLENLDALSDSLQHQLTIVLQQPAFRARILASYTLAHSSLPFSEVGESDSPNPTETLPTAGPSHSLLESISTITIEVPRLIDRIDDLPLLAQAMLEACNRGNEKQIGSIRPESLDKLALYSWPGELDELREIIAAAHASSETTEISVKDLPAVIHHAFQTASRSRKSLERINLDELLAKIEQEAIVRALAQAGGNKTEAAELLGMTRPRLYRRLVQLGLVSEREVPEDQVPVFIEQVDEDSK